MTKFIHSIKFLHVLAPGRHLQGIKHKKTCKYQYCDLGITLTNVNKLELLNYKVCWLQNRRKWRCMQESQVLYNYKPYKYLTTWSMVQEDLVHVVWSYSLWVLRRNLSDKLKEPKRPSPDEHGSSTAIYRKDRHAWSPTNDYFREDTKWQDMKCEQNVTFWRYRNDDFWTLDTIELYQKRKRGCNAAYF